MRADTTKAMQDALDAAVRSLNSGSNGSDAPARPDTMGAILTILPKLLRGNEASEQLVERMDKLQKGDIAALKEQVQVLRKQSHRLLKAQELLLTQLAEIDKRQHMMIDAILALQDHMARVLIVEDPPDGDGVDGGRPTVDGSPGRGEPLSGRRKRPQPRTART